jgi:hypothetical protein
MLAKTIVGFAAVLAATVSGEFIESSTKMDLNTVENEWEN